MPNTSELASIAVIDRVDVAATLLKPLRLRILENLREGDSAAGLARLLGVPRQKLSYHLGELERQGLVELVEERRKGNCTERIVRARARAFLVAPRILGELAADRPERVRDRFSWSYLVTTFARAVQDLVTLRGRADLAGRRLPTLSLETRIRVASPARLQAFAEELSALVGELVARHHDEDAENGRTFTFLVGGYPTPPANDDPTDPAEENPP